MGLERNDHVTVFGAGDLYVVADHPSLVRVAPRQLELLDDADLEGPVPPPIRVGAIELGLRPKVLSVWQQGGMGACQVRTVLELIECDPPFVSSVRPLVGAQAEADIRGRKRARCDLYRSIAAGNKLGRRRDLRDRLDHIEQLAVVGGGVTGRVLPSP